MNVFKARMPQSIYIQNNLYPKQIATEVNQAPL